MTCLSCARDGVPIDARDPALCVACAIRARLRRLGPFPTVHPEETETAINRNQIHEQPGRNMELRCMDCKMPFWWVRVGRRPPGRCHACKQEHQRRQKSVHNRRYRESRKEAVA